MTEHDLTHRLRTRYCAPEWAFLAQVRNGTGYSRRTTRTADGLAMSLWPSRGIHLHGFEIKVSRSDFTRELKDPSKAEDIARFCHFWWIVAPTLEVAPVDLMPPNWGLLIIEGECLKIAKQAVLKEADAPDFIMLASIFRKVHESMVPADVVSSQVAEQVKGVREKAQSNADYTWNKQVEALREGLRKRMEQIGEVEKALGCSINEWNGGRDAAAIINLASELRREGPHLIGNLRNLVSAVKLLEPALTAAATELEEVIHL